jgi:hypothetical protein
METPETVENELPAETPQTGEQNGQPARTDGIAAALAVEHGAATHAGNGASQAEPAKPGKQGRPITHGLYSKAMGSDGKRPVKAPGQGPLDQPKNPVGPAQPARVVIPSELLSKVVKETLSLTENLGHSLIESMGKRAGLTDEDISPQLKQAELGESRKQIVADLTPYMLAEWGVDAQMSPTVAVALILTPWGFGSVTAYLTLARIAEEKEKREMLQNQHDNRNRTAEEYERKRKENL